MENKEGEGILDINDSLYGVVGSWIEYGTNLACLL
jgi:hypothetical protein